MYLGDGRFSTTPPPPSCYSAVPVYGSVPLGCGMMVVCVDPPQDHVDTAAKNVFEVWPCRLHKT